MFVDDILILSEDKEKKKKKKMSGVFKILKLFGTALGSPSRRHLCVVSISIETLLYRSSSLQILNKMGE